MTRSYVTKQQLVYESLREQIMKGKLPPGTALPLADLTREFGVSHIPVREALRQLETEQLVELHPHATAVVALLDRNEAESISQLRFVLEPLAAREAAGHVSASVLEELQHMLNGMDDAVSRHDTDAYMQLNRAFHFTIYALGGNKWLVRILGELWDAAQRFSVVYRLPGHIEAGQQEHQLILDALRAGDADACEAIVRRHRLRIMGNLQQWLDGHAEPEVRLRT